MLMFVYFYLRNKKFKDFEKNVVLEIFKPVSSLLFFTFLLMIAPANQVNSLRNLIFLNEDVLLSVWSARRWDKNQRHGEGTLLHADGTIFRGQFYRDKKNGPGTMTSLDGSCYEGETSKKERETRSRTHTRPADGHETNKPYVFQKSNYP